MLWPVSGFLSKPGSRGKWVSAGRGVAVGEDVDELNETVLLDGVGEKEGAKETVEVDLLTVCTLSSP